MKESAICALAVSCLFAAAAPASAQDCATPVECQPQLRSARLSGYSIYDKSHLMNPDGMTLVPPSGTAIYSQALPDGSSRLVWQLINPAHIIPTGLRIVPGGTGKLEAGMTIALAGSSLSGLVDQGLVTLYDKIGPLPAASIAFKKGRGLVIRYYNDDWITLWDPPLAILEKYMASDYFLTLRFQPDGKLMVDIFLKKYRGSDCSDYSCMRYAVLLDYGWPMLAYPDEFEPKPYSALSGLYLGANEADGTQMATPSVTSISVYGQALNEKLLQTALYFHGLSKGHFPFTYPEISNRNRACNDGGLYTLMPKSVLFDNLCGSKASPFSQRIMDDWVSVTIKTTNLGPAITSDANGNVALQNPSGLPEQNWTIDFSASKQRNFKFVDAWGHYLAYDPKTNNVLSTSNVTDYQTYWHFDALGRIRTVAGGFAAASLPGNHQIQMVSPAADNKGYDLTWFLAYSKSPQNGRAEGIPQPVKARRADSRPPEIDRAIDIDP